MNFFKQPYQPVHTSKWLLLSVVLISVSCVATHSKTSKMTFDKEGHRGCRGLMPENTIPAMLKAIDLGVTTLEMDAVITADSQVLLSHEPFFNHEITTKSDGTFIPENSEKEYNIYKMTYAETQKFDVGLKAHPRFPKQQKLAVTKPLLADMIDSVETFTRAKHLPPVTYNIETKTTPQTDALFHPEPDTFVRLLMHVLQQKNITDRVIIQSFDIRTLQILHQQYPHQKTSLLIDEGDTKPLDAQLRLLGFTPTIYSPYYLLVNADLVQQCKTHNMKLIPWTVNTLKEIKDLKKLGADGMITDYPDLYAGLHE
jgi:glycerophosphoryl diester phosphodiesterase